MQMGIAMMPWTCSSILSLSFGLSEARNIGTKRKESKRKETSFLLSMIITANVDIKFRPFRASTRACYTGLALEIKGTCSKGIDTGMDERVRSVTQQASLWKGKSLPDLIHTED